jgi:metallo-beta-lactamase family protein
MRIQFLGAARTTTGSMYLLELNQRKYLLECGLFQGRREESIRRNCCFSFNPADIDAVILSHAHIDHCGNLPNLCKQGFDGFIYSTFATRDLASVMLPDSAEIQRADAEYLSKQAAKKGLPPVEPLYKAADAEKAVSQFVTVNYRRSLKVGEGLRVTFYDAGHILGSAQVALDVEENGRKYRYLFSGDIGRGHNDILRDPEPVEGVDYLQVESTYGGRDHASRQGSSEEIARLINETFALRGKVIIPAFSVGRTQEIVYTLHQLVLDKKIPSAPIFVDSPLSVNATEIFRLHPECFNTSVTAFLREKENPFGMANLVYIREQALSMKLNDLQDPAVIISASGMAEAGRVRHHLKNNIGDPRNLILFVGYCAEHTLGAQIMAGRSQVNIFGEPHNVRARVASLDSFSGHADRTELARYVGGLSGPMKRVFVIHGEEAQSLAFAETLRAMKPSSDVLVPERGQEVDI